MRKIKLQRVDIDMEKQVRLSALNRIKNNIDMEIRSFPEMTKMMMNTPSFPNVIKELETIPRKEDLKEIRK